MEYRGLISQDFLENLEEMFPRCSLPTLPNLTKQFLQTFPKLLVTLIMHTIIICYNVYIALYI